MDWSKCLTKEQAELIKRFRVTGYDFGDGVKKTCTWRAVARRFADAYPELNVLSGNQIEGMMLCEAAMKILGESYERDDW